MDYQVIWQEMHKKPGRRVFLFHGKEDFLWEELLVQLKDKLLDPGFAGLNYTVLDGKAVSLPQVMEMAITQPFLDLFRLLVVQDAPYFKGEKKGKAGDISDAAEPEGKEPALKFDSLYAFLQDQTASTCLVFTTREVDQRRTVFKKISKQGMTVEFLPPRGWELTRMIEKKLAAGGKRIRPDAVQLLLENTLGDIRLISQELEKISLYVGMKKVIQREDVTAIGSRLGENNIFALVDSLGARQKKEVLGFFRAMLQAGEPPIRILFMLARQVRLILEGKLLVQKGYTAEQIAGSMGIPPFVARKCLDQGQNFTLGELRQLTEHLLEVDATIKTGRGEARTALELILCRL